MTRVIRGRAARGQLADAIQAAVAGEFLAPGPRLVVHAPVLTDPALLDNRQNAYRTLLPDLGYREVRLSDVVRELLLRGAAVDIGYRVADRSAAAAEQLRRMVRREAPGAAFRMLAAPDLPGSGILLTGYFLDGDIVWEADGIGVGPAGAAAIVGPEADEAGAAWLGYWEEHGHAATGPQ